jgi:hypothetical protein
MKPISTYNKITILDDFYTDPDAVRNMALTMDLEEKSSGNYGGRMTNDAFITQEHLDAFSEIIGKTVVPATCFTGKFRFITENPEDNHKQLIHFDPSCDFAGVWYGSKDYPENIDGTSFWKHNRTGIESIPLTQEGIEQYGWNNVDDLKTFLETDGIDYSLWTNTITVPYKYNRLIMFPAWLFHAPGTSFGTTIETSRMISTFFLKISQ